MIFRQYAQRFYRRAEVKGDKYGIVRKLIQMRTLKQPWTDTRGGGHTEKAPRGVNESPK